MIGLGLVTYNRPLYFEQCARSIAEHLSGTVDHFVVYDDCSDTPYSDELTSILPNYLEGTKNRGVAFAKNRCLEELLTAGCDWLVLAEDDILVQSSQAISGYIAAAEASGWQHLMFHGHGPANPQPMEVGDAVTLWPNYVGAWSLYSRASLEKCGLLDEEFVNAWEHVEHSLRLSLDGFTPPWRGAADATGSEAWLREIPGSSEGSVIAQRKDWSLNVERGMDHFRKAHADVWAASLGPIFG